MKSKYIIVLLCLTSCLFSCNKNTVTNTTPTYYLNIKIGDNEYKANNYLQSFEEDNIYSISDKQIRGYIDGPNLGEGIKGYTIKLNNDLSIKSIDFSDLIYTIGGATYNCNNSNFLSIPTNITNNDNSSGGVIEGSFTGQGIAYGLCGNTCKDISGSFKLKIK